MTNITPALIQFVHKQNQFQKSLGHLAAWLALSLVLLSALIVVLRYGFNTGSIALQETILYNHAIFFMMGMAYTLQQDRHVRVDVFYSQMSSSRQAWVNLIGGFFFALPTLIFLLWVSWGYVSGSWAIQEGSSEAGGLPYLYLLKTFILIMGTLMLLQVLAMIVESYLQITAPTHEGVEKLLAQKQSDSKEMF